MSSEKKEALVIKIIVSFILLISTVAIASLGYSVYEKTQEKYHFVRIVAEYNEKGDMIAILYDDIIYKFDGEKYETMLNNRIELNHYNNVYKKTYNVSNNTYEYKHLGKINKEYYVVEGTYYARVSELKHFYIIHRKVVKYE